MDRSRTSRSALGRRSAVALIAAAACAAMLSACVVQPYQPAPPTPYPTPPPQPAYSPPPPAYSPPPESYNPPPPAEPQEEYSGEVAVTAPEPPPPLPVYEQPPCPADGYLWTPGYWAWGPGGYYWVPGTWVMPPAVGLLWTPGYWAFVGGVYGFHPGYWGPHVGFYGGVNYGFGYVGVGFVGGRWDGNRFAYNTAVVNVNRTVIHNTYNETIVNNVTVNRVSYNGGPAGVHAAPTPQERAWSRESHVPPTPMQVNHVQQANRNPALFAHANGGNPAIAATARPATFSGAGVVSAHGASPIVNQPGHGPTGVVPARPTGSAAFAASHPYAPAPQGGAPKTPTQTYQPNANVAKPQAQYAHPPRPSTPSGTPGSGGKPPTNSNANKGNAHPEHPHEGEGGH